MSFNLVRRLQRLVDEEDSVLVGWDDEATNGLVGGPYYASMATSDDSQQESPAIVATSSGESPLLDSSMESTTTGSANDTAMGAQSFFGSVGLN